ncbi:MAG TPA: response regulator [Opitutaceae bacterium]|nr:response regulator [Opitutaceae bacterium]
MRILILEDDRATAHLLAMLLTNAGHTVEHGLDGAEGMKKLRASPCDLVISDVFMVPIDGFDFLASARSEFPRLLVVLASACSDLNARIANQPHKPFDVIHKPFRIEEVKRVLARATEALSVQAGIAQASATAGKPLTADPNAALLEGLERFYPGAAYASTRAQLSRVMRQPGNAMVVAKDGLLPSDVLDLWREASPQPHAPWQIVVVETDTVSAEQALFASASEAGPAITAARGGTLLILDLDRLSLDAQARLSPLLKGTPPIRLLISLSRDPDQLLDEGLIDESLYFRFSTATVLIPPLSELADQIDPLFLAILRTTPSFPFVSTDLEIEPAALAALRGYSWPNNVTEVHSVAAWVATQMRSPRISLSQLPERFQEVRLTTLSDALLLAQREHLRRIQRLSPSKVEAAQTLGISPEDFSRSLTIDAPPLFTLSTSSGSADRSLGAQPTSPGARPPFLILAPDERLRLSLEAHFATLGIGTRLATDGFQAIAHLLLANPAPRVALIAGSCAPFELEECVSQLRRVAPSVIIATLGSTEEIEGVHSFAPLESMDNLSAIIAHLMEAKPPEAPQRPVLKLRR